MFPVSVRAWDDCPFGEEDDHYPGECGRYIDTDGDGICDHSQLSPEERELAEAGSEDISAGEAVTEDVSDAYNVVSYGIEDMEGASSSDDQSKQPDRSSQNPYNFAVPFLVTIILYAVTWSISGTGIAKKNKILSKPVFNLFWNTVLILSAIPSVAFGFYLIFRYSIPALREVDFDFLYWHVEGSVVFGTTALMHLLSRLRQYVGPFRVLTSRP